MTKPINAFMISNREGGPHFNKNNFIASVEFTIGIPITYNNIVTVGY